MKFDDLIALNDHLLAHRAPGSRLTLRCAPIGGSLASSTRRLRQIERRLSQGESLEAVLADQALEIPAFYLTAIATATRTGNLASCTESIAHSLQRVVRAPPYCAASAVVSGHRMDPGVCAGCSCCCNRS